MEQSADFINAFIQKQKNAIEDLFAQKIILETRLELTENVAKSYEQKIQELEATVSSLERKLEDKPSKKKLGEPASTDSSFT